MKIKNKDIVDIVSSINTLSKEKLPIKLSWRLETSRKALLPFFETVMGLIDQTKQNKALKNPDGSFILAKDQSGTDMPGTLMFDKKDIEELNKEINSLLDEEVEISNISLKLSEFPDDLTVSADSIRGLGKILEE